MNDEVLDKDLHTLKYDRRQDEHLPIKDLSKLLSK